LSPRVRRSALVGASVTAGLLLTGAAVGAALAAGILAVVGLVVDGPGGFPYIRAAFGLAAAFGALIGGVGLPVVAWGWLRHVALGRVVLETGIGTVLGGLIGFVGSGLRPLPGAAGALAGFLLAAVQLRVRRPPSRPPARPPQRERRDAS
jgi:hypothetical protein